MSSHVSVEPKLHGVIAGRAIRYFPIGAYISFVIGALDECGRECDQDLCSSIWHAFKSDLAVQLIDKLLDNVQTQACAICMTVFLHEWAVQVTRHEIARDPSSSVLYGQRNSLIAGAEVDVDVSHARIFESIAEEVRENSRPRSSCCIDRPVFALSYVKNDMYVAMLLSVAAVDVATRR